MLNLILYLHFIIKICAVSAYSVMNLLFLYLKSHAGCWQPGFFWPRHLCFWFLQSCSNCGCSNAYIYRGVLSQDIGTKGLKKTTTTQFEESTYMAISAPNLWLLMSNKYTLNYRGPMRGPCSEFVFWRLDPVEIEVLPMTDPRDWFIYQHEK